MKMNTKKGFEFEKVENGWKDLTSGLIWYPKENWTGNYFEALKKFGDKLPTKKEFEIAEKHGIREVFDDFKGFWFWSQTVHPKYAAFAYVFSGVDGYVDYYSRDGSYNSFSARCVGR